MTGGKRIRNWALSLGAVGLLAAGWVPAQAGPASLVPPWYPSDCDPTRAGISMPGCPSVLVGEAGDVMSPSIALPDLVPDVQEVNVEYDHVALGPHGEWIFGTPFLNFDTRAQNLGRVPVDLQTQDLSNLGESAVGQCVSWTTNLVCRERRPVGGLSWHNEHLHYHFNEFAAYELRRVQADGGPDMSAGGLIASSPKVSFCLVDSARVQETASPVPRYTSCQMAEEGISPGYTDIYGAGIEGQQFSLAGLSNGRYALVLWLNPAARLLETNPTNNRVIAIVEISNLWTLFPTVGIVSKELG